MIIVVGHTFFLCQHISVYKLANKNGVGSHVYFLNYLSFQISDGIVDDYRGLGLTYLIINALNLIYVPA
ncbi:hypothetical protein ES703_39758 [subsurface metagenome]